MAKIFRHFNNFHERIFSTDSERTKPAHVFSDHESNGVLVCSEIDELSPTAGNPSYSDYPYIMHHRKVSGLYSSRLARSSDDLLGSVHSDRRKSGSPGFPGHNCCSSSSGSRTRQLITSIQMLSNRSRGVLRRVRPRQPEKVVASRSTSMSSSCSSASSASSSGSAQSSASGGSSAAHVLHLKPAPIGSSGIITAGFNPVSRSDSFKFQPAGKGGVDHNIVPPRRLRKKCTRSPYLPEVLEDYSSPVDLINHSKFRCVNNGSCGTQLVQVNEDYSEAVDSKTYVVPGDDVTTKIYCSSSPLANCDSVSSSSTSCCPPRGSAAVSDLYSQPYDSCSHLPAEHSAPSAVVVDVGSCSADCTCRRCQSSRCPLADPPRPPLYENVFESGCKQRQQQQRKEEEDCGHGGFWSRDAAGDQQPRASRLSGTKRLSRSCDLLVESEMSRRLCYETAFDTARAVSPDRRGHDPDLFSHLASQPVPSSLVASRPISRGSTGVGHCDGDAPCRVCVKCCAGERKCSSVTSPVYYRLTAASRRDSGVPGVEENGRDCDSGYRSVQVEQSERSSTVSSSASTGQTAGGGFYSDSSYRRLVKHSCSLESSSSSVCPGVGGGRRRRPHSVCVVADVVPGSGSSSMLFENGGSDRVPPGGVSEAASGKLGSGEVLASRCSAAVLSPISDRSQETDYSPADWSFTNAAPFKLRLCSGSVDDRGCRFSSTFPAAEPAGRSGGSNVARAFQSLRPADPSSSGMSDRKSRHSLGESVPPIREVEQSALPAVRKGHLEDGPSDQGSPEFLFNMPKLRRRGTSQEEQCSQLPLQRTGSPTICQNGVDERRTRLSLNIPNRSSSGDECGAITASLLSQLSAAHVSNNCKSATAGPADKINLIDTSIPLHRQRWYHGAISRLQAERILRSQKEGSYLVRISESNRLDYSLSLKSPMGFMHMKIRRDADSSRFILGQFSRPFESIVHLIDHYSRTELPVRGAEHMSLLRPVSDHQFL